MPHGQLPTSKNDLAKNLTGERQQGNVASSFDSLCELALMSCAGSGLTTGPNLSFICNETAH